MLKLGQLHHSMKELEEWLNNTVNELDSLKPPPADDPRQVEIELAKHKVYTLVFLIFGLKKVRIYV